jgi:MFS family permease
MAVSTGGRSRNLILAAMIFAVAMTFIDQTIVSIAVPEIQKELGLSGTGVQWAVNAYLLTLAAFFAFGGRLACKTQRSRRPSWWGSRSWPSSSSSRSAPRRR